VPWGKLLYLAQLPYSDLRLREEDSSDYWLRVQFRVSGTTGARKMQDRGMTGEY
jgi:hypothetical protein